MTRWRSATPQPETPRWKGLDDPKVQEAFHANIELVGRTGAKAFEVGHLHDTPVVELAGWYAHAEYQGARIMVENHRGPVEATEALARRLLEGGQCQYCLRTVSLTLGIEGACCWYREGRRWKRGCE